MAGRLYVYKLMVDNGGAPCVHGNRLTLAICKPRIRSSAGIGDVIFGFAANSLSRDNRLIYIARVTGIEPDGGYYDDDAYAGRPDRIYVRGDDGHFRIGTHAHFHAHGRLLGDRGATIARESEVTPARSQERGVRLEPLAADRLTHGELAAPVEPRGQ